LHVTNQPNGTIINNTVNVTFQNETSALLYKLATQGTTVLNPPVYNISNISITKTGIPNPVAPGAQLSYTITVASTGNMNATNVAINDTYPLLVVYDSSQPAPLSGTNNTWILGNMTPGTSITINITVNVSASAPDGTLLNNTANVTYENSTGAQLSAIVSDIITVSVPVPPQPSGGGGGGASRGLAYSGRINATNATKLAEAPVAKECVESWKCNEWGLCADNKQVRTCTDLNACGTRRLVPQTVRECRPPATVPEQPAPAEEPPAPKEQPAETKPATSLVRAYILPAILALVAIIIISAIIMDFGRRKKPVEIPEREIYMQIQKPKEEHVPEPALPEPEGEPEPIPVAPQKPEEPGQQRIERPVFRDRVALAKIEKRLAEIDRSLSRLKKSHRRLQKVKK
ncbi:MAG: DUF11 domain-containing protein, partial [Candidatus Woesearchaeota archaeon]